MKKVLKWLLGTILALAVLAVGSYCALRFGFDIDLLDRSGWNDSTGAMQYLDYYGNPKLQWQYIDGKLYYFDPDTGNMITGWQQIGDAKYYFDADGVRCVGWLELDGKTYYLGLDGKLVAGWQKIENQRYYFSNAGIMQTGWITLEGKQYYLTDEGYALSGWADLDGSRYRFTDDGAVMTGWFEDGNGKYYLGETGALHSGWVDIEDDRYYFTEKGVMYTGWLTLDDALYYLQPDGVMTVGQAEIDGATYFFTSAGKSVLLCNVWNPVPKDFVLNLVDIGDYKIDASCRDALAQMMADCRNAGYTCYINNSYRSKEYQQYLWNRSVSRYMAAGMSYEQACAETGKDTALPGHSEHQTGLAVDITGTKGMYAWLEEHCWDYGFILRYPADCTEYTGIIYEPWHFRYVGTELALELKALGLCMEEYMIALTEKNK